VGDCQGGNITKLKNKSKNCHSDQHWWLNQFSIMLFKLILCKVISQLYQSRIDQSQKLWELQVKLWLTIQWLLSFLWEHVFSEFLTQLFTYFQHTCSSSMESIWPCNKKQGLMSVAFCSTIMITTYDTKQDPMSMAFPYDTMITTCNDHYMLCVTKQDPMSLAFPYSTMITTH
jgi:hypothetical protein